MRRSHLLLALTLPLLASCEPIQPELPLHGRYALHSWNGERIPLEAPLADYPRTLYRATLTLHADGTYQEEWYFRNFYHNRPSEWVVRHSGEYRVTWDGRSWRALHFRHDNRNAEYTAILDRDGIRCHHSPTDVYLYRLE